MSSALAAAALLVAVAPAILTGPGSVPESREVLSLAAVPPAARPDAAIQVVREGDSVAIVFPENGSKVHQIALSTHPSFAAAKVTEFQGDRWVDPAPAPIVGGVVFYRID